MLKIASHRGALVGVVAACLAMLQPAQGFSPIMDLPTGFDLSAGVQLPPRGTFRMDFNVSTVKKGILFARDQSQGYMLTITAGEMTLYRWMAGMARVLPLYRVPVTALGLTQGTFKLTLQRRPGSIAALINSRLVLKDEDTACTGGEAWEETSAGAQCTSFRMQPVEGIVFSDDFMRQPTEAGEWDYNAGGWQIQAVGNEERGANPFSLEARPAPCALATAGNAFWSDYRYEAAARAPDGASFGICAGVQDSRNFYLLQWTGGKAGRLGLLRVVGGKASLLASRPGGFIPEQWYQLGLRMTGGQLVAEVDHQPILSAIDPTFGKGRIGLYASGDGVVHFDSVLVRSANVFHTSFTRNRQSYEGRWETIGQQAVYGSPDWGNCTVDAQVSGNVSPAGLLFHYQSARSYYLFDWSADRCALYSVFKGDSRLLASASVGVPLGATCAVQAGVTDGYLWGAINGRRVVEGLDFALATGRAGIQPSSAAGSSILSVTTEVVDPPDPTDRLTVEFTDVVHHKEMKGWSGPLEAWNAASIGAESGYWHKQCLYGNTTIRIPLSAAELKGDKFALLVNSDGKSPASGYELDYTGVDGKLMLTLQRLGKTVASGSASVPADKDTWLEVHRQGPFFCAVVGPNVPIAYRDSEPLDGYNPSQPMTWAPARAGLNRLGIIVRGVEPDIAHIEVKNSHVYAETFHLAPVNWRPQSGDWTVTSRWACQPGWTWFGGKSTGYAVNWYKSPLWGDQSIDAYTGVMMAAVPDSTTQPNRESWRDLNCVFCADGVNLFSGYSLVLQGWHGSVTRLLRKGKVVAESHAFDFPVASKAHRLWFDIHINKEGPRIACSVSYYDESGILHSFPLIEWTDPHPLQGGYTGFWTYDNGMMISRAVLSAQGMGPRPFFSASPVWLAQLPDGTPYPDEPDAGAAARPLVSIDAIMAASKGPQAEAILSMDNIPARYEPVDIPTPTEAAGN